MENCIFCKIANGQINTTKVYENQDYVAFNDINPKAPVHILVIPKKHIESFHLVDDQKDKEIVKGLFDVAWEIIKNQKLQGCQLHINSGSNHGQEVMHIHLHLLSKGKSGLNW